MKVLIIEDDQAYRKVYSRKFEVAGFSVEVAENGVEGLAKARANKPDIILTDLMMPQMDGFQLLDAIQSDAALKIVPVIVLTNLSTPEDTQKVLKKGAKAVMVKSDNEPNAIVEAARQVL